MDNFQVFCAQHGGKKSLVVEVIKLNLKHLCCKCLAIARCSKCGKALRCVTIDDSGRKGTLCYQRAIWYWGEMGKGEFGKGESGRHWSFTGNETASWARRCCLVYCSVGLMVTM